MDLATKTKELNTIIAELDAQYSEAKKTAKFEMDKSAWAAFGIQGKR